MIYKRPSAWPNHLSIHHQVVEVHGIDEAVRRELLSELTKGLAYLMEAPTEVLSPVSSDEDIWNVQPIGSNCLADSRLDLCFYRRFPLVGKLQLEGIDDSVARDEDDPVVDFLTKEVLSGGLGGCEVK